MDNSHQAKRRFAGLTSLQAILTSASIVAVLGGWGLISLAGQNAQTEAGETSSATTTTTDSAQAAPTPAAPFEATGRLRPRHGGETLGDQPGWFSPDQAPGSQSTLPRTRSSQ